MIFIKKCPFWAALSAVFLQTTAKLHGQPTTAHEIHALRTEKPLIIDGNLDDAAWKTAPIAAGFWRSFPNDTAFAKTKTEVRLLFDDKFIYIGVVCKDDLPGNTVQQTLKRDFSITNTDCFAIALDPTADKINGFNFTVSPAGVQREGLISNGGVDGVTTIWDQVWQSETKLNEGGNESNWTAELAIPFRSLRYNPAIATWGINFARQDLKRNEQSTWSAIPRGINVSNLAYEGKLVFEGKLPPTGANIVLNPYLTGGAFVSNFTKSSTIKGQYNGGIDAKIGIGSSLNLDLTINPDFSQVEVDKQVTNLDRFNVFFPERRTFFTENADITSFLGNDNARPFFSRNIGLSKGQSVPIYLGAKLSGKIDAKTRIYTLAVETAADSLLKTQGQNYTVAAIQRNVLSNSTVTLFAINRQAFDKNLAWQSSDFNRIVGGEFGYVAKDSRWSGKAFFHYVFNAFGNTNNPFTSAVSLSHAGPKWYGNANIERIGEGYTPSTGFVPRLSQVNADTKTVVQRGFYGSAQSVGYLFFPKNAKSSILYYGPEFAQKLYFTNDLSQISDRSTVLTGFLTWRNGNIGKVFYKNNFVSLPFSSDIGANTLPKKEYNYSNIGANYTTNARKVIYGSGEINYGTYYAANYFNYKADFNFRVQPWGAFGINAEQNFLTYTESFYKNEKITLLGARMEFSFNRNLFLTNFLQYNTQAKNFNINSRIQWRFKPMSDVYLVYTDNYESDVFSPKSKAIVLKVNYWLGL
ncbi:MAG: hypothetical protein RI894_696 [Bacteroidota bacterium]|jgi:hypothetical protein